MSKLIKLTLIGFATFANAFDLEQYRKTYEAAELAYEQAKEALRDATGPYKAARDAYVAATSTFTQNLYEDSDDDKPGSLSLGGDTFISGDVDVVHNHHYDSKRRLRSAEAAISSLSKDDLKHLHVLQTAYWSATSPDSQHHTAEKIASFLKDCNVHN